MLKSGHFRWAEKLMISYFIDEEIDQGKNVSRFDSGRWGPYLTAS
jgi:hypothetical protein